MEMIRLEEPVLAMAAIQRKPIQRPFGERKLLGGVAGEADARNQGVLEPRAKSSLCLVKVAAGEFFSQGVVPMATPSSSTVAPEGLLVNCNLSA